MLDFICLFSRLHLFIYSSSQIHVGVSHLLITHYVIMLSPLNRSHHLGAQLYLICCAIIFCDIDIHLGELRMKTGSINSSSVVTLSWCNMQLRLGGFLIRAHVFSLVPGLISPWVFQCSLLSSLVIWLLIGSFRIISTVVQFFQHLNFLLQQVILIHGSSLRCLEFFEYRREFVYFVV